MPNICKNHLICRFSPFNKIQEKFRKAVQEKRWFAMFTPSISKTDNIDFDPRFDDNILDYDLMKLLWTKKEEAFDVVIHKDDNIRHIMKLSFSTERNPPISIYRSMWDNYGIEVLARFYEPGDGFFGKYVYNRIERIEIKYNYPADKEGWEQLKKHVKEDPDLMLFIQGGNRRFPPT